MGKLKTSTQSKRRARRQRQKQLARAFRSGVSTRAEALDIANNAQVEAFKAHQALFVLNIDDRMNPESRLAVNSNQGSPFVDCVHGLFELDRLRVSETKSRVKRRHVKRDLSLSPGAIRRFDKQLDRAVQRPKPVKSEFTGEALSAEYWLPGHGEPARGTLHSGVETVWVPSGSQTVQGPDGPEVIAGQFWEPVPLKTFLATIERNN